MFLTTFYLYTIVSAGTSAGRRRSPGADWIAIELSTCSSLAIARAGALEKVTCCVKQLAVPVTETVKRRG